MRYASMVLALVLVAGVQGQDYPRITLSSPTVKLTVYPPDAEKGFYRGSRFCWGGVLGDLEVGRHKLFHAWKDKHNPKHNDDILGPVLEFGQEMPLGYAEAKPGGNFVKVGVGELVKPEEKKYSFFTNYTVANPGVWKIKPTKNGKEYKDGIEFRQTLRSRTGYEYHLAMEVHLFDVERATTLLMKYELVNVGEKPIETDVYNHNFFNVDKATVGPDYVLRFTGPVEASAESQFGEGAKVQGQALVFPQPLTKGQAYGQLVNPMDKSPYNQVYAMEYTRGDSTITVHVRDLWPAGTPRKKFTVWSIGACACPEPFYPVIVAPGESVKWSAMYDISVAKKKS